MKKLLVTVIGATAAIGAFADYPLQFDSFEDGAKSTTELNATHGNYWYANPEATDNEYKIEATLDVAPFSCPAPLVDMPDKALSIKTKFTNPLSANLVADGATTNINDGLFFDSLVKFTVCDTAPETNSYDNAKIVLWLQENEDLHTTNLWIRAGYLSYDGGAVTPVSTNYMTGYEINGAFADTWHRVTIKAIADITETGAGVPGFAVYIDANQGVPTVSVTCGAPKWGDSFTFKLTEDAAWLNKYGAVFPSMVQSGANKQKLEAVAFDGTGSISDLVFTDQAPAFAADYASTKATVTIGGHSDDYTSLESAVAAVNAVSSGDVEFTLAKGMTITESLEFTSDVNITFDFAGVVLTNDMVAFAITNTAATITFVDNVGGGGIYCASNENGAGAVYNKGKDVTINAGNFWGKVTGNFAGLKRYVLAGGAFMESDKTTLEKYIVSGKQFADEPTAGTGLYAVVPEPWFALLGAKVDGAYEIDGLDELKAFQQGVADGLTTAGVTFKLTTDIALDAAWPGIGIQNGKDLVTSAKQSDVDAFDAGAFQGTFDGQNHTISGFRIIGKGDNAEGLDYAGFFNSTYGATIQNLKIQYAGSLFAADTASDTKESGATFVGVAKNSTLRNLTTVAGTVSCSKGFGGIVGYLYGTTVDSCTNNVNMTSLANNKCGGIAMICQKADCSISNCENNGTMTTGSGEHGGIVGYTDTITINNCKNTAACKMFYHHGGTVTLQGTNTGNATVQSYTGNATPGLNFATVDGSVATFVADDALALNGAYKVMATGATATFAFAEAGTIAFDTNLTQNVTFNITYAQGQVTDATVGGVVTFTAAAAGLDPASNTPVEVEAESVTEATNNVVIVAPTGVDAAAYKDLFDFTATPSATPGKYDVSIARIKETVEQSVAASAEELVSGSDATGTITIPAGLYYKVTPSDGLPISGTPVKGLSGGTTTTITKPTGTQGFIKVEIGTVEYK